MKRFSFAAALAAMVGQAFLVGPAASQQQLAARPAAYSSEVGLATFDSAWARIRNTHYDASFNGLDWDAIRMQLRPRAASASSLAELRSILRDMLARLGESHYSLIPFEVADALGSSGRDDGGEAGYPGDAGLDVRIVEGRLAVWRVDPDGPAAAAGIRPGWTVESIGGYAPADGMTGLEGMEPGIERSNALTRFLFASNGLLDGPAGSILELIVSDAKGRRRDYRIERRRQPGEPIRFGDLPTFFAELHHERIPDGPGCIGLIRLNVWMVPMVRQFDRAVDELRDCAGLVIDLRGNPGGVAGMVMGIAGHFLNEPVALGTMRSRGTELNFVANPRRVDSAAQPVDPFAGPLAILIDAMSVSTSEIFAGGLQAIGRARIFGETSAGQALPAATLRLPSGDVIMHVVADFTAAGGTRIEGRGVIPDRTVSVTREALLAGHDQPLDSAVAWIRSRHAAK
jgi:carboxyl-terminal processing protease